MSDIALPNSWLWTTLGEICSHPQYGYTTKAAESGDTLFLRTTDITSGKIEWGTVPFCAESPDDPDKYQLHDGDIVISRAGSVGFSHLVQSPPKAVFASYLIRFRPFIDRHYFALFLKSPFYWHSISDSKSGIAVGNVNAQKLAAIPLPLPPLPEQKRIVAKIEELFSELEAGEESLRVARRQLGVYRQSLLKQAFEGKLTTNWRTKNRDKLESPATLLARIQVERQSRYEQQFMEWEASVKVWASAGQKGKRPMKPTEPAIFAPKTFDELEVPEGWAAEQIGNCPTDALIGLVRSADEQHAAPSGVSYIKMDRVDMLGNTDLRADVFVDCTTDEVERFALRKGDLLFNTRNSVELVGKVGIVRRDPETPTVYNNNLMRLRLPDCLDPVFVGLQLCAQPFRQRMEEVKKATTSVAAVYGKDFWPLPLVLCSLPEQQEIVRVLDEQFEGIERNEREIDGALRSSAALRQAILKKAFTGRLVPQNPSDEPATTLLARIKSARATAIPANRKVSSSASA